MEPLVLTISGNEVNGYRVLQKLNAGDWYPITKRYSTYEEACKVLDEIQTDNS